mgnify:CR=1 FL=1
MVASLVQYFALLAAEEDPAVEAPLVVQQDLAAEAPLAVQQDLAAEADLAVELEHAAEADLPLLLAAEHFELSSLSPPACSLRQPCVTQPRMYHH